MENDKRQQPQHDATGLDMEAINEFDQNHFYETDHVDQAHFAEQNRSKEDLGYQEISGTASIADRLADEEKINQVEVTQPNKEFSSPTKEDGEKLMNVGRAPDA
jgi:hypothetical protein